MYIIYVCKYGLRKPLYKNTVKYAEKIQATDHAHVAIYMNLSSESTYHDYTI